MHEIVVLDGFTLNPGDLSWERLKEFGNVTVYDRTEAADVVQRIGDADIVFVNKVGLPREVLQMVPSVRYIGVLATGYNVVDIDAAREQGIIVANIPTYGTAAVAQFVFAMLLEIAHHVQHHSDAVKQGRWTTNPDFCFWDYPLIELAGKTMGIIGYGRIGQATAKIAKAFGMNVIAHDAYRNPDFEQDYRDLDTVLAQSDVIALHCPLLESTRGIINEKTISRMKHGVIILNNSRGPLIVEKDLADALHSGKVFAAGLDVVSSEPIAPDNPLLSAPNCIITPHISWAPKESRQRLMNIAIENLQAFLSGTPMNVVNN